MGSSLSLAIGMCLVVAALPFCAQACAAPAPVSGPQASAAAGWIRINEVMYDPEGDEASGEWIELVNVWTNSVNVAGWTISDQEGAADFAFPAIVFPAGGIAVVWVGEGSNATSFSQGSGGESVAEFHMGKATSLLSNTGDDILLRDQANATVDFVSYGQWDGASVQPPPADFIYGHSNATAAEGYSVAWDGNSLRQSVPTRLRANGDDWPAGEGLVLSRVHYYPWGENEFVAIRNTITAPADISSWYITDGEGMAAFPPGTIIQPGAEIVVAQNATNYHLQTLEYPDFEYCGSEPAVPDAVVIGSAPAMANSGDEAILMNSWGTCIDAFAYGNSFYQTQAWTSAPAEAVSQGQVARRAGGQDTNTSADWDSIRRHVIGQSEFSTEQFTADGPVTVFVSPDSSFATVAGALDNATARIWLCVYEFTSQALADKLVAAAMRGLDVRLFLEGSPVGGLTSEETFLARKVAEAGGQVRLMTNDPADGRHERYAYVHAKYAVIDSDRLLITSENWAPTGMPAAGDAGNRGWGALVTDTGLADYFSAVFLEDWNPERADSMAFDANHPLWNTGTAPSHSAAGYGSLFPPMALTAQAGLVPVLAPDNSLAQDTVLGMMASATERVYVEQFYAYKHWGSRTGDTPATAPNLYLEAAIDAARRGCEVRILLDATYYNTASTDPIDNDDTAAYVNAIAMAESLDLEAKLVNATEHDFDKIHNKGVIADGAVLISSINWNLNSVTANRESGLIIRNAAAADYFASVFAFDWQDDWTPPFAHFGVNTSYAANTTVVINGTASSDNVGIVNYTWALDGSAVCWGPVFSHRIAEPGQHALNLTVRDAWGNAGTYERTLVVLPADAFTENATGGGGMDTDTAKMLLAFLLIPVFIFAAIIAAGRVKRKG